MAENPKPYPTEWDDFEHTVDRTEFHLNDLAEMGDEDRLEVTQEMHPWASINESANYPGTVTQERIEMLCVHQAAFIVAQGWALDPQPFLRLARLISDAHSGLPIAPDMSPIWSARADAVRLNHTLRAVAFQLRLHKADLVSAAQTPRVALQGPVRDLSPDSSIHGSRPAKPGVSKAQPEPDEDELADRLSEKGHYTKAALVKFMKGRTSATLDEIKDRVQGDPTNRDGSVKGLASRTTQEVRASGSSLEYRVRGHELRKLGLSGDLSDWSDCDETGK